MINVTTEYGFTTTVNTETSRATSVRTQDDLTTVCFGFFDGGGDDFRVSRSKPSRTYKTPKGAARAVAKWTA